MKRDEYFPTLRAAQPEWYTHLADKMEERAGELGLDPLIAAARANDCRCEAWYIGAVGTAVRDHGKAYTASLDVLAYGTGVFTPPVFTLPDLPTGVTLVASGAQARVFAYIQQIKLAPGYTEALGIELGIVGPVRVDTHLVPEFTLKAVQGPDCQCVELGYKKYGHTGVFIQSRVNGGDWVDLAVGMESPYLDSRPLALAGKPEVREFRLRFWDKGVAVGDWTPVQKITIAP